MNVLFLIISLLFNLTVCNNGSNLEKLKNETEEYVDNDLEDSLTAPSTANALFVSVEYHHITKTASGMAGIFNDEKNDNKYTTLSDFKAKVYRTYSF